MTTSSEQCPFPPKSCISRLPRFLRHDPSFSFIWSRKQQSHHICTLEGLRRVLKWKMYLYKRLYDTENSIIYFWKYNGSSEVIWLSKFIESIRQTFRIDSWRFPKEHTVWICANVLRFIIICSHLCAGYLQMYIETSHVADILQLQFTAPVTLLHMLNVPYFNTSTFRSLCAVPNMAVFYSSLISSFPGMLLRYLLNDCEMGPDAHIITGINSAFTFHMRCIYIVRSLYIRILSPSSLITFLSPETATSISTHVPFSLPPSIMSGLLSGMVRSVCICWFRNSFLTFRTCHYYYYYYES